MPVKITQLEAENIKRIKALTLTPAPTGLAVIGGRNNRRRRQRAARMGAEGLQGIATRVSIGGEYPIFIEDGCLKAPDGPAPAYRKAGAF